jgi:DNA-binding beta-propeller fold protein YncE
MRRSIVLVLSVGVLVGLSVVQGQWLETTIDVGGDPVSLCYNPTDNKVYCVREDPGAGMLIIDAGTNVVVDTIHLLPRATGHYVGYNSTVNEVFFAANDTEPMWCLCLVVDGSTNSVTDTLGVGRVVVYINNTNDKAYFGGRVILEVWDCVTHEELGHVGYGFVLTVLCHNPVENKVYAAVWNPPPEPNSLIVIDGEGDSLLQSVDSVAWIYSACYDMHRGKVYAGLDSSVYVIDGAGDTLLGTISVPDGARRLGFDSIDGKLYCVGEGDFVTVIDCSADTVLSTFDIGRPVSALLYEPSYNNVYCVSGATDTVTVVDCAADTVLVTIAVGDWPYAFCRDTQSDRVYVANYGDGTISVIRADPAAIEEEVVNRHALPHGLLARDLFDLGGSKRAELLDVSGRRVTSLQPGQNDIRHVTPGVYFVRREENVITTKMVVQR